MNQPIIRAIESALDPLRQVSKSPRHFQALVDLTGAFLDGRRTEACADGRERLSSLELTRQFSIWLDDIGGDFRSAAFVKLSEAIDLARLKHGWPLCAPPVPVQLPQQPSTLRGDVPHDLTDAMNWCRARQQQVVRPITDAEEGVGELILSLILDCGVTSQRYLMGVLRSISGGLSAGGTFYWTNTVGRSPGSGRYLEFRRVFLQEVSAILAIRFGDAAWRGLSDPRSEHRRPSRAARDYLKRVVALRLRALDVPAKHIPRSIDHVLRAGIALLRTRIPGYLAAFSRGDLKATSVPEPAFLRLLGIDHAHMSPDQEMAGPTEEVENDERETPDNPFSRTLVRELSATFLSSRKPVEAAAAIAHWRQTRDQVTPPSIDALCAWVESQLGKLEPSVPTGSTSRIVREALQIAPVVAGTFGMADPRAMSVDDLIEARSVMADVVSDWSDPGATVRRASRFVDYCVRCSNPEIEKIGQLAESKTPDANLITFADIKRAMQALESGRVYVKDAEMLRNQLTFLAACSMTLRSSEARGLLFEELAYVPPAGTHERPMMVIAVQPNVLRGLKTLLSRRYVPDVVVDTEIAEYLILLVEDCGDAGPSAGIFGSASFTAPNRDWAVGRPAQAVLQAITKDSAIRPYHLRHSAASRILLALASRFIDLSPIRSIPFVSEAIALSDRIGDELINAFDLRRDLLWMVAIVMGHSNPGTTANNYLHVLDLLLYAAIVDRLPKASFAMLAAASGIPRSSVYRLAAAADPGSSTFMQSVERANPARLHRNDIVEVKNQISCLPKPQLFQLLKIAYEKARTASDHVGSGVRADFESEGLLRSFVTLRQQQSGRKRKEKVPRHDMEDLGGDRGFVPYPLSTLESTAAAVALCDALESLPLEELPTLRSAILAYVVGGYTAKTRIRFPSEVQARAFVRAMDGRPSISVQLWPEIPTGKERLTVSITVRGQANDRGSRTAFRWVFQMLAAITLART